MVATPLLPVVAETALAGVPLPGAAKKSTVIPGTGFSPASVTSTLGRTGSGCPASPVCSLPSRMMSTAGGPYARAVKRTNPYSSVGQSSQVQFAPPECP